MAVCNPSLLVDDEVMVLVTTADMLGELGFEVIDASNGKDALAILTSLPRVDVLVADHMMPQTTGAELVQIARSVGQSCRFWSSRAIPIRSGWRPTRRGSRNRFVRQISRPIWPT
jgi:CheY-like chemotaxis protein